MAERPIIFSAPMVRAILAGKKTQTRRIIRPQPARHPARMDCIGRDTKTGRSIFIARDLNGAPAFVFPIGEHSASAEWIAPHGIGDTLWVREAWGINHFEHGPREPIPKARPAYLHDDELVYFATETDPEIRDEMPRRPSIHMPRWASRITLRVTDVRVQRLHDISQDDALAEGCRREYLGPPDADDPERYTVSARASFSGLWDRLHAPGAWDANPWVVALTFTREPSSHA